MEWPAVAVVSYRLGTRHLWVLDARTGARRQVRGTETELLDSLAGFCGGRAAGNRRTRVVTLCATNVASLRVIADTDAEFAVEWYPTQDPQVHAARGWPRGYTVWLVHATGERTQMFTGTDNYDAIRELFMKPAQ